MFSKIRVSPMMAEDGLNEVVIASRKVVNLV